MLQIIPTLERGGAEKQMVLLACGLRDLGIDVHVCTLTRGGPLAAELTKSQIPVHAIEKRWKFDPSAWWRLRCLIQRLAPTLVHTWIFAANSYGRHAAHSGGVKYLIAGERCVDPWKRGYEFWIDRQLSHFTQRIATNSSGVVEFYTAHGIPRDKFTVIPNGIPQVDLPSLNTRTDFLQSLDLPSDTLLVGAVGRLWPQKRYKDLIWAAELLKSARDDVHFLIIGEGPQRWRLERFIRQIELGDRMHLLGERQDVPQILRHLDCFWIASGYEGQSNGVLEAMQAGLPVVASDIPGNRDLVLQDQTGYLVPLGDRAEFARRVHYLLDHADERRRLGVAGQARVLTEFSVTAMVEKYRHLYAQVAGQEF